MDWYTAKGASSWQRATLWPLTPEFPDQSPLISCFSRSHCVTHSNYSSVRAADRPGRNGGGGSVTGAECIYSRGLLKQAIIGFYATWNFRSIVFEPFFKHLGTASFPRRQRPPLRHVPLRHPDAKGYPLRLDVTHCTSNANPSASVWGDRSNCKTRCSSRSEKVSGEVDVGVGWREFLSRMETKGNNVVFLPKLKDSI